MCVLDPSRDRRHPAHAQTVAQDVLESPPLESADGKGRKECIACLLCKLCGPSVETHPIGSKRVRSGLVIQENAPEVRNKGSLTKIDAALPRDVLVMKWSAEDTDATDESADESRARESRERSLGARGEIQSGQARGSLKLSPRRAWWAGGRKKYCRHRRKVRKVK